jgi:hypothetical protein
MIIPAPALALDTDTPIALTPIPDLLTGHEQAAVDKHVEAAVVLAWRVEPYVLADMGPLAGRKGE